MKAPLLSPKVASKKLKRKRKNGSRKSEAFTPASHSNHLSRINLELFVTVDFSRRSTAFSQISSSFHIELSCGLFECTLHSFFCSLFVPSSGSLSLHGAEPFAPPIFQNILYSSPQFTVGVIVLNWLLDGCVLRFRRPPCNKRANRSTKYGVNILKDADSHYDMFRSILYLPRPQRSTPRASVCIFSETVNLISIRAVKNQVGLFFFWIKLLITFPW